jgi:lysozyme
MSLKEQLARHEGFRAHAYQDTEGIWTIGYGRNIDPKGPGITRIEAGVLLDNDIARVMQEIEMSNMGFVYHQLSEVRKDVIRNMWFNLGHHRIMGFRRMWAALADRNYKQAAAEMLDSRWAIQVGDTSPTKTRPYGGRAWELAYQMRTGEYYEPSTNRG